MYFFYRYRSNSLDSILVADLDKQGQSMEHLQEMVSVHHHSQRPHASSATYHVFTQQHHFIPKHQIHQLRKHQGMKNEIFEGFLHYVLKSFRISFAFWAVEFQENLPLRFPDLYNDFNFVLILR